MDRKQRENKMNKAGKSELYTFVFLVIMSAISEFDSNVILLVAVLFLIGGGAVLGYYFVKKSAKNSSRGEDSPKMSYRERQSHKPRAYNPGEIRDQDNLRRLQQLDSFLENGLIDRKEYNVLRAKYERYMRENENS